MKKNRFFSIIICFIFISLVLLSSLSPKIVFADNKEENKVGPSCILCKHTDPDDPLYEKERQFYEKVNIISSKYGKSVDPIVLVAAVTHHYSGVDLAYEGEYDEDFNEAKYSKINGIFASSSSELTDEEKQLVQENEKIDLLTLAALVMVDSNRHGTYNDACFKKGLAGNGLSGNITSNDDPSPFDKVFNKIVNEVVCSKTINEDGAAANDSSSNVRSASEKLRIENIKNVCNNGYVGGLYNGISKLTDEQKKQKAKEKYAQDIIDLANYYKTLYSDDSGKCAANIAGTTGTFADWKQFDNTWGDISVGGSRPMRRIGCLITSVSIQVARSGTKIGTLPSGFNDFNPGAFVTTLNNNGGFAGGGNFAWTGFSPIAPNWRIGGSFVTINSSNTKKIAEIISNELLTGYDNKYQKFIVICLYHNGGEHWVAVNGVENGQVKIFDPGRDGDTIEENYAGESWYVDGYKVMYATDVLQGQSGTTSNNSVCSNNSDLSRFANFLAANEGHATCNYKGRGENTGYTASTLAGDAGGQTTAFGMTSSVAWKADEIGYTNFKEDLYNGCTDKAMTEKLFLAVIDYFANDLTQAQVDRAGITVSQNELYALSSVNYGGVTLAEPIISAIKTYGKASEEVFYEFKTSFGVSYAINNGFHGLMRRRLTEYEIFATGNYEAESSDYLQSPYIQNGLAMSKSDVTSHFPTRRTFGIDELDFIPVDYSAIDYGEEVECVNGRAQPVKQA